MLSVGRRHLLYPIANAIMRTSLIRPSGGVPCRANQWWWLVKKLSDYQTSFLMDTFCLTWTELPLRMKGKPSISFHHLQFTRVLMLLLGVMSLLSVSLMVIFICHVVKNPNSMNYYSVYCLAVFPQ